MFGVEAEQMRPSALNPASYLLTTVLARLWLVGTFAHRSLYVKGRLEIVYNSFALHP